MGKVLPVTELKQLHRCSLHSCSGMSGGFFAFLVFFFGGVFFCFILLNSHIGHVR